LLLHLYLPVGLGPSFVSAFFLPTAFPKNPGAHTVT
jgi:hypothetical protein